MLTVDHDDKARLLARKEIFNDDTGAGAAKLMTGKHVVDGGVSLFEGHGDDNALAGGKAVGLDDDRSTLGVDIGMSGLGVAEGFIVSRRNAVTLHEGLGEVLGAFKLCGLLCRTEDVKPLLTEFVDNALGKRCFGADHRKIDTVGAYKGCEFGNVGDGDVFKRSIGSSAGVTRGDVDVLDACTFGNAPCEGVFATAATNNENLHGYLLIKRLKVKGK